MERELVEDLRRCVINKLCLSIDSWYLVDFGSHKRVPDYTQSLQFASLIAELDRAALNVELSIQILQDVTRFGLYRAAEARNGILKNPEIYKLIGNLSLRYRDDRKLRREAVRATTVLARLVPPSAGTVADVIGNFSNFPIDKPFVILGLTLISLVPKVSPSTRDFLFSLVPENSRTCRRAMWLAMASGNFQEFPIISDFSDPLYFFALERADAGSFSLLEKAVENLKTSESPEKLVGVLIFANKFQAIAKRSILIANLVDKFPIIKSHSWTLAAFHLHAEEISDHPSFWPRDPLVVKSLRKFPDKISDFQFALALVAWLVENLEIYSSDLETVCDILEIVTGVLWKFPNIHFPFPGEQIMDIAEQNFQHPKLCAALVSFFAVAPINDPRLLPWLAVLPNRETMPAIAAILKRPGVDIDMQLYTCCVRMWFELNLTYTFTYTNKK